MNTSIEEFIEHLSERPWSEYTASDYSVEQWHAACLIHLHDGAPTSKGQCKLPVKTPNGAVNRNGVHAAAAALAGARGGVHASSEQKASAARALRGLYNRMNEKPPPSLASHSNVVEFIEHHGVKGMRWGVRKIRSAPAVRKERRTRPQAAESKTVEALRTRHRRQLTNKQLKDVNERLNLEKNFGKLNPSTVGQGRKFAAEIVAVIGLATSVATFLQSPMGKAAIRRGRQGLGLANYGQMKLPGM